MQGKMKKINNWISDLTLVLFPPDPEKMDGDEVEKSSPLTNFVVFILIIFTVVMLVISTS